MNGFLAGYFLGKTKVHLLFWENLMQKYRSVIALVGLGVFFGSIVSINASDAGKAKEQPLFDKDRGNALLYNHPVVIQSSGRTLWTHAASRIVGDSYNPAAATTSLPDTTAAPNDFFELLASNFGGSDVRARDGACLMILQNAHDAKQTGAVHNGDVVKIISLFAAAGAKAKEGVLAKGRYITVHNSSRLGDDDIAKAMDYYDVFVVAPEHEDAKSDKVCFTLQTGKDGIVYAQDSITLLNKKYNKSLIIIIINFIFR